MAARVEVSTEDSDNFQPTRPASRKHPKSMPVILPEADYRAWLTGDWDESQALACPFPSQLMEVASPAA